MGNEAHSIPRTLALAKAFRNAVILADDDTTGEEVIAALSMIAAEMIDGQDDEETGQELLGKLIVATHIGMLKYGGYKVEVPHGKA